MSNYHAQKIGGANFKSKKELKEFIARNDTVIFTDTSMFDNGGSVTIHDLPEGSIVVGPDPYRDRRWYGAMKKGKIV